MIDGSIRLTLGEATYIAKKVKPCITKQQNLTKLATMVEEKSRALIVATESYL